MQKETSTKKWEGRVAPAFSLPDQNGEVHSLKDYRGKIALVYFYPKDMTSGCTLEAQGFRDMAKDYKKAGIEVLGISVDSVSSHKKFCEKESLDFTILADEKKEVVSKYDVWKEKSMYGKKYMGTMRESFLLDKEGKIVKHYEKVSPIDHPSEVLQDAKELIK